jgi:hypothetical protein
MTDAPRGDTSRRFLVIPMPGNAEVGVPPTLAYCRPAGS